MDTCLLLRGVLSYLGGRVRYNLSTVGIALNGCLLDVCPSNICDLLDWLQLIMLGRLVLLAMLDLVLRPSRVLSLRRLQHNGTFGEGHLRWIFPIVCPSILFNLLDLIDLRLTIVNWLYFKRVIVRSHRWRMHFIQLLGRAHNEVMLWLRIHGLHYKVVSLIFFIEGPLLRWWTLL